MSELEAMLDAYDADHAHPANRALHLVGITSIGSSVALVLISPLASITLFVVGWGCQLAGHAIEGKPPSFTRDPRFMGVGALWYAHRVAWLFGRGRWGDSSRA